jgi:ATP-dependent Clp protease ATP-binding subunit ClpX
MAKKGDYCSFCGKPRKDTSLLISGMEAHICDQCIDQAQLILKEELQNNGSHLNIPDFKLMKPLEPACYKRRCRD